MVRVWAAAAAQVVLLRPAAAATKDSGASGAEDGFIDDVIRVGLIGGDVSNKKGLSKALFLLPSSFPADLAYHRDTAPQLQFQLTLWQIWRYT